MPLTTVSNGRTYDWSYAIGRAAAASLDIAATLEALAKSAKQQGEPVTLG